MAEDDSRLLTHLGELCALAKSPLTLKICAASGVTTKGTLATLFDDGLLLMTIDRGRLIYYPTNGIISIEAEAVEYPGLAVAHEDEEEERPRGHIASVTSKTKVLPNPPLDTLWE